MKRVRVFASGNATPGQYLAKGKHRPTPTIGERPAVWMLFRAMWVFLPRWQDARLQAALRSMGYPRSGP